MMHEALEQKIRDKQAVVGVVGLGYVGLPLLNAFIKAGFKTMGFDIDQRKVDALLKGQSYIKHIESAAITGALQGITIGNGPATNVSVRGVAIRNVLEAEMVDALLEEIDKWEAEEATAGTLKREKATVEGKRRALPLVGK